MPSARYFRALGATEGLSDAEIIELHRVVSTLASAAYKRQPRYQENYAAGVNAAKSKTAAARRNSSPEITSGAAIRDATSEGQ